MRFNAFMEFALYDAEVGFYATAGRAGRRRGDFVTSPETGPLFGVVVGRYLDRVWHELGEPADFTLVDAGAGPGSLARSVLAGEPECSDALQIVCVETSAAQRSLHPDGVESVVELPEGPIVGVVFANELLDNLPIRIVEFADDEWGELFVDGGSLIRGELDGADQVRCAALVPGAADGVRIPLADRAERWVAQAVDSVERGSVVVIDYGASTAALAGRTMDGWLRTYRGHERGVAPTEAVGEQDITADVPFDQLPPPTRQIAQAEWLSELGIADLVDEGRRIWSERAGVGDLAALKARSRINEAQALTDLGGLGGFSVVEWRI